MQNLKIETPQSPEKRKIKKRHGLLTAYLILLIVLIAGAVAYFVAEAISSKPSLTIPGWALSVLAVLGLLEIVCVIAILKWKKWGFWGYCALEMIVLIVDISSGESTAMVPIGLVLIALMAGALNIGNKENKGWSQLD
jgi:hypothetical protein